MPVLAVGPFGHHPRNERHAQLVQRVGQAVDGDGLQAGIAEDHLVQRLAGRVAVVGGLDVEGQDRGAARAISSRKRIALAWPRASKSWSTRAAIVRVARVVPQRPGDLRGQLVVQAVDQVADVVGDVAQVQALAAAIAGVEDLLQVLGGRDDDFVVGQRAVAQVADRADLGVGLHDALGQLGQLFFEAQVGSHGCRSWLPHAPRAVVCGSGKANAVGEVSGMWERRQR